MFSFSSLSHFFCQNTFFFGPPVPRGIFPKITVCYSVRSSIFWVSLLTDYLASLWNSFLILFSPSSFCQGCPRWRSHGRIHCLEMFEGSYAYLHQLYMFNWFACQTSSKRHSLPNEDKKGGFPPGPTVCSHWLWFGLFLQFSSITWDSLHLFLMLSGHFK